MSPAETMRSLRPKQNLAFQEKTAGNCFVRMHEGENWFIDFLTNIMRL